MGIHVHVCIRCSTLRTYHANHLLDISYVEFSISWMFAALLDADRCCSNKRFLCWWWQAVCCPNNLQLRLMIWVLWLKFCNCFSREAFHIPIFPQSRRTWIRISWISELPSASVGISSSSSISPFLLLMMKRCYSAGVIQTRDFFADDDKRSIGDKS